MKEQPQDAPHHHANVLPVSIRNAPVALAVEIADIFWRMLHFTGR
jgi:hypothetical protein